LDAAFIIPAPAPTSVFVGAPGFTSPGSAEDVFGFFVERDLVIASAAVLPLHPAIVEYLQPFPRGKKRPLPPLPTEGAVRSLRAAAH